MEKLTGQQKVALIGAGSIVGIMAMRQLFPPVETRLHVTNKHGIVEADPEDLARVANVSLPVYALASCMQSEENSDKGRLAVGLAVRNAVKRNPAKIPTLLLFSKQKAARGRFGGQVGRYAATSKGPTARTLQLAQAILDGRVEDITHGAIQWDAPKEQDRRHQLYLRNPTLYPEYRFSSEDIADRRRKAGRKMIKIPGVPNTRFWAMA